MNYSQWSDTYSNQLRRLGRKVLQADLPLVIRSLFFIWSRMQAEGKMELESLDLKDETTI